MVAQGGVRSRALDSERIARHRAVEVAQPAGLAGAGPGVRALLEGHGGELDARRRRRRWSGCCALPDNDLLDLVMGRAHARDAALGGPGGKTEGRLGGTEPRDTWKRKARRHSTYGDGKSLELPVYGGTIGPGRRRHPRALRQDRDVHLRPGLPLDRRVRLEDHLHRRRRGRAALSRLPDRAARGELRLPRGLLPAAERRAAQQGRRRTSSTGPSRATRWCTSSWRASSRASAATRTRWR